MEERRKEGRKKERKTHTFTNVNEPRRHDEGKKRHKRYTLFDPIYKKTSVRLSPVLSHVQHFATP